MRRRSWLTTSGKRWRSIQLRCRGRASGGGGDLLESLDGALGNWDTMECRCKRIWGNDPGISAAHVGEPC